MPGGVMGAIIWGTSILLKSTLTMLVIGKQVALAFRLRLGQQLPRNRAWPRTAADGMRVIGA
jgi:hypothetical protein